MGAESAAQNYLQVRAPTVCCEYNAQEGFQRLRVLLIPRAARSRPVAASAVWASDMNSIDTHHTCIHVAAKIAQQSGPAVHLHHGVDSSKRVTIDTGPHDIGQSVHLALVHSVALQQASQHIDNEAMQPEPQHK
jgi:hypothetical protein